MGFEIIENNIDKVLDLEEQAVLNSLDTIGMKAEKYAKALCPVGTSESTGKKGYRGGTLRESITHEVDPDISGVPSVTIGSNVEYAPYVELGTGPNFTPPPEWEEFDAPKGSGVGSGFVRPRKFLQPAIADHLNLFINIIKTELSK